MVFLIINFITLGIIAGLQNYNFQVATQQRDQQDILSRAIYKILNISASQDQQVVHRQTDLLNNQEFILKTLKKLSNSSMEDQAEDHEIVGMLKQHLAAMNRTGT